MNYKCILILCYTFVEYIWCLDGSDDLYMLINSIMYDKLYLTEVEHSTGISKQDTIDMIQFVRDFCDVTNEIRNNDKLVTFRSKGTISDTLNKIIKGDSENSKKMRSMFITISLINYSEYVIMIDNQSNCYNNLDNLFFNLNINKYSKPYEENKFISDYIKNIERIKIEETKFLQCISSTIDDCKKVTKYTIEDITKYPKLKLLELLLLNTIQGNENILSKLFINKSEFKEGRFILKSYIERKFYFQKELTKKPNYNSNYNKKFIIIIESILNKPERSLQSEINKAYPINNNAINSIGVFIKKAAPEYLFMSLKLKILSSTNIISEKTIKKIQNDISNFYSDKEDFNSLKGNEPIPKNIIDKLRKIGYFYYIVNKMQIAIAELDVKIPGRSDALYHLNDIMNNLLFTNILDISMNIKKNETLEYKEKRGMLFNILKTISLIEKGDKLSHLNNKLIRFIIANKIGVVEKILINLAYESKIDKNKLIIGYSKVNNKTGKQELYTANELIKIIKTEKNILDHLSNIINEVEPNITEIPMIRNDNLKELVSAITERLEVGSLFNSDLNTSFNLLKEVLSNDEYILCHGLSIGYLKLLRENLMKNGIINLVELNNMMDNERQKIIDTKVNENKIETAETSASGNVGKKDSHQNDLTTHQDNQTPQKTSPSVSQGHQDSQNLSNSSTWQSSSIYEPNLFNQISSAAIVDNWVMIGDEEAKKWKMDTQTNSAAIVDNWVMIGDEEAKKWKMDMGINRPNQ